MAFCLQSNRIYIFLGNLTDFVVCEDIWAHPQQHTARFFKPRNNEYSITDKQNIEFEQPKKDYVMQFQWRPHRSNICLKHLIYYLESNDTFAYLWKMYAVFEY